MSADSNSFVSTDTDSNISALQLKQEEQDRRIALQDQQMRVQNAQLAYNSSMRLLESIGGVEESSGVGVRVDSIEEVVQDRVPPVVVTPAVAVDSVIHSIPSPISISMDDIDHVYTQLCGVITKFRVVLSIPVNMNQDTTLETALYRERSSYQWKMCHLLDGDWELDKSGAVRPKFVVCHSNIRDLLTLDYPQELQAFAREVKQEDDTYQGVLLRNSTRQVQPQLVDKQVQKATEMENQVVLDVLRDIHTQYSHGGKVVSFLERVFFASKSCVPTLQRDLRVMQACCMFQNTPEHGIRVMVPGLETILSIQKERKCDLNTSQYGTSPILLATSRRSYQIAEQLVEQGADIFRHDLSQNSSFGANSLEYCNTSKQYQSLVTAHISYISLVEMVQRHVSVETKDLIRSFLFHDKPRFVTTQTLRQVPRLLPCPGVDTYLHTRRYNAQVDSVCYHVGIDNQIPHHILLSSFVEDIMVYYSRIEICTAEDEEQVQDCIRNLYDQREKPALQRSQVNWTHYLDTQGNTISTDTSYTHLDGEWEQEELNEQELKSVAKQQVQTARPELRKALYACVPPVETAPRQVIKALSHGAIVQLARDLLQVLFSSLSWQAKMKAVYMARMKSKLYTDKQEPNSAYYTEEVCSAGSSTVLDMFLGSNHTISQVLVRPLLPIDATMTYKPRDIDFAISNDATLQLQNEEFGSLDRLYGGNGRLDPLDFGTPQYWTQHNCPFPPNTQGHTLWQRVVIEVLQYALKHGMKAVLAVTLPSEVALTQYLAASLPITVSDVVTDLFLAFDEDKDKIQNLMDVESKWNLFVLGNTQSKQEAGVAGKCWATEWLLLKQKREIGEECSIM